MVRISADLTDFLSNLDKMTKGVDKAAERVASLGEKLTVGLTIPLTAAGVAMAKFAADSEDTSARFSRVFGSASDSVKASLEAMTKVVPETVDELEKLATQTDLMLQGMQIAPDQARDMSVALVKLAGDMAAVTHVPIADALDALDRGLAGSGRGLVEAGLGFTKNQLQQEAYRADLLKTGETLTESGRAQAAFNLIMQNAGIIQGEAARTAGESSKSWQFLEADLKNLAVSIGSILLPPLTGLVNVARDVVTWFNNLDKSTKAMLVDFAEVVAVVGPIVVVLSKLTKAFFDVSAALKLLEGSSGIASVFAAATNPVGQFLLLITAVAAATVGLAVAWDKATDSLTDFLGKRGLLPANGLTVPGVLPGVPSITIPGQNAFNASEDARVLGQDPALAKFVAGFGGTKGKGGPTSESTKSPFQQLVANAGLAETAFQRAADYGDVSGESAALVRINQLHAEAVGYIKQGADAFTEESVKAQELADKLQLIRDAAKVAQAPTTQAGQALLDQIGQNAKGDSGVLGAQLAAKNYTDYYRNLSARQGASQYATPFDVQAEASLKSRELAGYNGNAGSVDTDLNLRQAMLGLPDGFNAAKQAAVEYGEAQRKFTEDNAVAFETLKLKLNDLGIHLGSLSPAVQQVVVSIANAAQQLSGYILSTIGGSGKGANTGRGIGGLLGGIVGSAFGPLGTAVGTFIGSAAGGEIGGMIDHQDKNTNAIAANTLAVTALTESITNQPTFFKIGQYDFEAALPLQTYPGPVVPPAPPPPLHNPLLGHQGDVTPASSVVITGDVHVHGVQDPKSFYEQIKQQALRDRGTGSRSALAFSGGF